LFYEAERKENSAKMKTILLIYLIGYIICYFQMRSHFIKIRKIEGEKTWRISDKIFTRISSFTSWVGVFSTVLAFIIVPIKKD
jgi:hypothetical protein